MQPLSKVVNKAYVTLYGEDDKVIISNDPNKKGDKSYGEVTQGQELRVHIDLEDIIENNGTSGIQEGVTYYMDLPEELVTDKDSKYYNPTEPVKFMNDGTLIAKGGIYTDGSKEQLRITFSNVESRTDVSGGFSYAANVSDNLIRGNTYKVDMEPCGSVSIKIRDEKAKLEVKGGFNSSYSKNPTGTDGSMYWSVKYTCGDNKSVIPDDNIHIDLDSNAKQVLSTYYNSETYKYWWETDIDAVVTYEDGTTETLLKNSTYNNESRYVFYTKEQSDYWGSYKNKNVFSIAADSKSKYCNVYRGKTSGNYSYGNGYMIDGFDLIAGNYDNKNNKKIKSVEFKFKTEPTESNIADYRTYSVNAYTSTTEDGYISASDKCADGKRDISVTLNSREITQDVTSSDNYEGSCSYAGLPGAIKTDITVDATNTNSDYYELEFDASDSNSLNAYYAICNYAFLGKEDLSGGKSFTKFDVAGVTQWQNVTNNYKSCSSADCPLNIHRVATVLDQNSGSDSFYFWRSKTTVNGEYIYVAIPASQYKLATSLNGHSTLTEAAKSNKPANWKIYVFNTAGTKSSIEFYQRLEALNSGDVKSGVVVDKLKYRCYTNLSYDSESSATFITGKKSMAYLKGYDMGDFVRWEVTLDTSKLLNFYNGSKGSWNFPYAKVYTNISDGQSITGLDKSSFTLKDKYSFTESMQAVQGYSLFAYDSKNKKWVGVTGPWSDNSDKTDSTLDYITCLSNGSYEYDMYTMKDMSYRGCGYQSGETLAKYQDSDGNVKLCYFTKKNDSSTSAEELKSEFEINYMTKDLVNFNHMNSDIRVGIRAITKEVAAKAEEKNNLNYTLTKDVDTENSAYSTKLCDKWTIKAEAKRNEDGSLGLIDDLDVSDNLSEVKATIDGKEVDIDASKYITLSSLKVTPSYLTNYSGTDFKSTKATSISHNVKYSSDNKTSSYTTNEITDLGINESNVTWSSSFKYSGNMKDGFSLSLSDLEGVTSVDVDYLTYFDEAGFLEAASEAGYDIKPNSVVKLTQSNAATSTSSDSTTKKSASKTIEDTFRASLSLDKSVNKESNAKASYKLVSEVGPNSGTNYYKLSDYLTSYKQGIGYDENNNVIYGDETTDKSALAALAKCVDVSNIKITYKTAGFKEQTIYENGKVQRNTWGFNVEFGDKSDAELFNLTISSKSNITVANATITVTYDATVDIGSEEDNDSFRSSKYYDGGELYIKNSAKATVPHSLENVTYTSDDGVAYADNDAKTLNCYAGAGVGAEFLSQYEAIKSAKIVKSESGDSDNEKDHYFTITAYTGSVGKDCPKNVTLTDNLAFIPKDLSLVSGDKTLTAEEKEYYTELISKLLAKHSYYYNLKVYRGECDEDVDLPSASTVLASHEDTITGDEILDNNVGLQYKPIIKVKLEGKEYDEYYGKAIVLDVDNMHYNMYASGTYQIKTDWKAFYKEAKALVTKYGYTIGDDIAFGYTINNNLKFKDKKSTTDEDGSKVEIASKSITKDYSNVDEDAGTADWSVNANTGLDSGDKITLSDKASVKADDEAVKAAAEKYTTITNVKVKKGGKVIYEEGGKDNSSDVTVKVDGLNITAEVNDVDVDTDYTLEYTTKLDKSSFVNEVGFDKEYSLSNVASMTTRGSTIEADKSADFKPSGEINATKSFEGTGDESGTAKWNITTSSGDIDRENFKIADTVESDDKANMSISEMTIKVGDKTYDLAREGIPPGASLYKADGTTNFKLSEVGSTDFVLVFDKLSANTDVSVDYTVKADKDAYSTKTGHTISMKNSAVISAKDGTEKTVTEDGKTYITPALGKTVESTSNSGTDVIFTKDEDGHINSKFVHGATVIVWKINVDLTSKFTDDQIAKAEDVTVTDDLPTSVDLYFKEIYKAKVTSKGIECGDKLAEDQYTITTEGNKVKVTVKNPSENNKFVIKITAQATASVDSVSNSAELTLGSKTIKTESDKTPSIQSVKQYGYIKSKGTPEYTPTAEKYVNHKRVKNSDEVFQFKAVEVTPNDDGTYSEVEGGYSSTARNDETGDITFDTDKYTNADTREGDHYYKITESKEIVSGKAGAKYTMDDTEFIVKVTVTKLSNGGYSVVDQVVSPDNYDTVKFDNAKEDTKNFKVTKTWDDDNDKAGKRPKSITVYLLNNGERYNGMSATLNEENNWTYTFENLPMADANYSVEEGEVEHYQSTVLTDGWQATINNKYVTNPNDNISDFQVTKTWDDNDNAAGKRPKSIKVYLTLDGKRYNNMSATLSEDNDWTYTFKNLPADQEGKFSVEEESVDYYQGTVTTADWTATITNKYVKDNPNEPTNPTTPTDTTNKTTTGHNGTQTGDNTPIGILFGLMGVAAIGGAFAAFGKRKREQK